MPRSHNAALQEREGGFNGVRVDVTFDEDALPMLNRFVLGIMHASPLHGEGVGHEFICHNHVNIVTDVLFDVLGECSSLHILSMEEAQITAALAKADHRFLGQKTWEGGYTSKARVNTYLLNRRNRDEKPSRYTARAWPPEPWPP